MLKNKFLGVLMSLAISAPLLAACGEYGQWKGELSEINKDNIRIALVSDNPAGANDQSFVAAAWKGVTNWAEENKKDTKDYKVVIPNSETESTFEQAVIEKAIDDTVKQGFNVIVGPGYDYQGAFEDKTVEYPNVAFIGIDFFQRNISLTKNSVNVKFKENESGFLAGYAAVDSGYKKLGFVGGAGSEAEQKYAMGFAAGAFTADSTTDFTADHVDYSGSYVPKEETKTEASKWYEDGLDLIFACAGGNNTSVFEAAKAQGGKTIGVDSDQGAAKNEDGSYQSDTIVASALKNLAAVVSDELDNLVDDGFSDGGTTKIGGIKEGWSGLTKPTEDWYRLNPDSYDKALKAAESAISNDNMPDPDKTNDGGVYLTSLLEKLGVDDQKASSLAAKLVLSVK